MNDCESHSFDLLHLAYRYDAHHPRFLRFSESLTISFVDEHRPSLGLILTHPQLQTLGVQKLQKTLVSTLQTIFLIWSNRHHPRSTAFVV